MVYIFTDGCCLNNQGRNKRGGYGVYYPDNEELNLSVELKDVTNNIAELSAVYYGVLNLITNRRVKKVVIVSDSKYVINSLTVWCDKWRKNGWKKSDGKEILNKDLIKKCYYLLKNIKNEFIHVNSHREEPMDKSSMDYYYWYGNYMADLLANESVIEK